MVQATLCTLRSLQHINDHPYQQLRADYVNTYM
jgi:hypothetical protein